VPPYVAAQFAGAILAMLLLAALLGRQGTAGLTLPGMGVSATAALLWEMLLTAGLVSVVLYTSSGAKEVGLGTALCVGGYIALATVVGASVSGAAMNTARSLGPAIALWHFTDWWVYLLGPLAGAPIAVGIVYVWHVRHGSEPVRRPGSDMLC
jgi:aquaporin Z